ncbi:hypothetical protein [Dinoroseobacter sp. S124A]|uniref:hypothetical protein n=1 Tax=Dinoroseobacter sp. S124A TaxID=3415128 RepID=UPI003C7C7EF6
MNDDNECPDCGSTSAVSKAIAWDAALAIPAKTASELERLYEVREAARHLVAIDEDDPDDSVTVSRRVFDDIRDAVGRS